MLKHEPNFLFPLAPPSVHVEAVHDLQLTWIHSQGHRTQRNTHLAATNSRDKGTRDWSKSRKKRDKLLPVRVISFHPLTLRFLGSLSTSVQSLTLLYASLCCQAEHTAGSIISFYICYIIWIIFRYHHHFLLLLPSSFKNHSR